MSTTAARHNNPFIAEDVFNAERRIAMILHELTGDAPSASVTAYKVIAEQARTFDLPFRTPARFDTFEYLVASLVFLRTPRRRWWQRRSDVERAWLRNLEDTDAHLPIILRAIRGLGVIDRNFSATDCPVWVQEALAPRRPASEAADAFEAAFNKEIARARGEEEESE